MELNPYIVSANCPTYNVDVEGLSIQSICDFFYVSDAAWNAQESYRIAIDRLNKKYGPEWPPEIEDFMNQWQKELKLAFPKDVVAPTVKTIPGTTPKGRPVVLPKRM